MTAIMMFAWGFVLGAAFIFVLTIWVGSLCDERIQSK
jgi:hypothetical protein